MTKQSMRCTSHTLQSMLLSLKDLVYLSNKDCTRFLICSFPLRRSTKLARDKKMLQGVNIANFDLSKGFTIIATHKPKGNDIVEINPSHAPVIDRAHASHFGGTRMASLLTKVISPRFV